MVRMVFWLATWTILTDGIASNQQIGKLPMKLQGLVGRKIGSKQSVRMGSLFTVYNILTCRLA